MRGFRFARCKRHYRFKAHMVVSLDQLLAAIVIANNSIVGMGRFIEP